jgi:hypothetical protein
MPLPSSSLSWISSSLFNNPTVLLVEIFNISETPINKGLLSSITQPRGATDVSQAESKEGQLFYLRNSKRWIKISTSAAVLSSIFWFLFYPSHYFKILSINVVVLVENGIWVITKVFCLVVQFLHAHAHGRLAIHYYSSRYQRSLES